MKDSRRIHYRNFPVYKYGRASKSGMGVSQHMQRLERVDVDREDVVHHWSPNRKLQHRLFQIYLEWAERKLNDDIMALRRDVQRRSDLLNEETSTMAQESRLLELHNELQSANCSLDLFKHEVVYVTTDSEPLIQGLYRADFYESDVRLLQAYGQPGLLAQLQAAKLTLGKLRSLLSRSPIVEVDKAISILMKSRRNTVRPARLGCQMWCTPSSTSRIPACLPPFVNRCRPQHPSPCQFAFGSPQIDPYGLACPPIDNHCSFGFLTRRYIHQQASQSGLRITQEARKVNIQGKLGDRPFISLRVSASDRHCWNSANRRPFTPQAD